MKIVGDVEVFLIARPEIDWEELRSYLEKVGGDEWFQKKLDEDCPDAEVLVEAAGRLCYRSWEPGLNKNVTKIRTDRGQYLENLLESGHGSVLEHANFTFVLHNATRVLTAELNRHRAGVAISEQSMRYVRLDDIPFRPPPTVSQTTQDQMLASIEMMESWVRECVEREIKDDMSFSEKKTKTSAIRRMIPMGVATEMVWTANIRTIRHVIEMRSAAGAEEEIRIFAKQLHAIMYREAPLLFDDYTEQGDGSLTTEYRKV